MLEVAGLGCAKEQKVKPALPDGVRDGEVGRHGHEEMDMIFRDRAFDDLHIFCLAYLSQKITESFCHLSVKHLLSVFGNPHQVVLEVIHRARSCPVILHTLMLLKSSPKGEGFTPRGRH